MIFEEVVVACIKCITRNYTAISYVNCVVLSIGWCVEKSTVNELHISLPTIIPVRHARQQIIVAVVRDGECGLITAL